MKISVALVAAVFLAAPSAQAQVPVITVQPLPLGVAPGDRGGFVVAATGAEPLQYQWYHDGAPVAGATTDLILIPDAKNADAGKYAVTVTNASGSATSTPAALTVENYTARLVDAIYPRPATSRVVAVIPFADGRVLVARHVDNGSNALSPLVTVFTVDAKVDPSFVAALPVANYVRLTRLLRDENGLILVCGAAGATESTAVPFLRRLNRDGTHDTTFQPPPLTGVPDTISLHNQGYVLRQGTRLVRLTQTGAIDSTFVFEPEMENQRELFVGLVRPDGAGHLVLTIGQRLIRLNADGRRDSTFTPKILENGVSDIQFLPNGAMMVAHRTSRASPFGSIVAGTFHLSRYTADGLLDPSFQEFTFTRSGPAGGGGFADFVVLSDRSVIVSGDFESLPAGGSRSYARKAGIARVLPDGTVDPAYSVLDPIALYSYTYRRGLALTADAKHVLAWDDWHDVVRVSLQSNGAPQPPRILRCVPRSTSWNAGDDVIVDLIAVGNGPLTPMPTGSDNGIVAVPNVQSFSGDRFVSVSGPGGTATSEAFRLNVTPARPRIVSAPSSITTGIGYRVTLSVDVRGTQSFSYAWSRNGTLLPETSPNLYIPSLAVSDVGTYRVRITNAEGMAEASATVEVGPHSELANLSARAVAADGDRALVIGFVVRGAGYNGVLLRGVGPELEKYGVRGVLADPRIALHRPDGRRDENEDSLLPPSYLPDAIERKVGASPLSFGTKSSALDVDVADGVYLLDVTGAPGTSGVALGEIYQTVKASCHLVNLSARAYVGTGDATAISGFVIRGDKPKRILVRAVGPTLTKYGVGEVLSNPVLKLVSSATGKEIAANDDWSSGANAAELKAAMAAVGAFPLEIGSRDAALIVTVTDGAYSALVTGADGGSGIALMEVYDLD